MLAKQEHWQVYIPLKETNHSHYNVRKPNEHYWFELLYVPHVLKGKVHE